MQSVVVIGNNSDIDSLIKKVQFTDDNILKCDLFNQIASEYLNLKPSDAILYANKAFDLSFRLNYQKGLARSYLIQGEANEKLNKNIEALDKYYSSLIIQKQLNDENEIAEVYYRLGRVCKTIGDYEKALECCLDALRIREKQNDLLSISDIYITMGSIYKYIGNYDKALEFYFKCMNIQKEHRNDGVSDITYNDIGIVYELLGRYDEAKTYYLKSLEIRERNKDTNGTATVFNNIAVILLDERNLEEAILYLRKGQRISEKYGNQKNLIYVYHNIARYYFLNKNYTTAIEYANRSLFIAQQLSISHSVIAAYLLLKDIYQAQEEFERALDYQIRYTKLNDSIFNIEKSMRIAHLENLYDNELKQVEYDLKDQRKKFINILIYGTLFFLIVNLFFIYISLRSKLKQNKLKRINLEMEKEILTTQLETKNREVTSNIIHLAEKNQLLLDLKKSLQNLKFNLSKDKNKTLIQSIINDMKASNNSQIWTEFEVRFIDVHKDFYKNLCKDFPDLTQNENRLAAFLKLNMTTKEISTITRQSAHSITVARTRLRKKLGLSNTDINLVSYMNKY